MKITPINNSFLYKTKSNPVSFSNRLPADSFSRSQNQETKPNLTLKDKIVCFRAVKFLKNYVKNLPISKAMDEMSQVYSKQLEEFMKKGKEKDYRGYIPFSSAEGKVLHLCFDNLDQNTDTMDIKVIDIGDNFKTLVRYSLLDGKDNYIYYDYTKPKETLIFTMMNSKPFRAVNYDENEEIYWECTTASGLFYYKEGTFNPQTGVKIPTEEIKVNFNNPKDSYSGALNKDGFADVYTFDVRSLKWCKNN